MRTLLIALFFLSFGLAAPVAEARGALPSKREQKDALESFRKFYKSKFPGVRASGVGKLRDMDFEWRVEELVKVIAKESRSKKEEDFVVVQEAIEVLGTTRQVAAIKVLMRAIIKEKKQDIRLSLVESLGGLSFDEQGEELPWDEIDGFLDKCLDSPNAEDVMAAADCYGALRRSDKFDAVVAHISHPDWRVRGSVVAAVVQMFDKKSHPKGLKELIDQLGQEKGKLRTQISDGLEGLTGWGCQGDVDCWHAKLLRWSAGQERLGGKGENADNEDDTAVFWDIPLTSDRLLLVVDVSSSMLERYHDPEETVVQTDKDWKDNPNDYAEEGELSKWDVAQEEIINALGNLKEYQTFNMIFFSNDPNKWQSGLVPASEKNRKKAIKKVKSITPRRKNAMTDMYGALEAAFKMAGGGVTREDGAVGIDTVFFFTDGYPTIGEVNLQTPVIGADGKPIKDPRTKKNKVITTNECYRRIVNIVKRVNRFNKVTLHTIGVGDHAETLLYALARHSGGQYRKVEQVMAQRAKKRKQLEGAGGEDN